MKVTSLPSAFAFSCAPRVGGGAPCWWLGAGTGGVRARAAAHLEHVAQLGVLRGVAPANHDGIDLQEKSRGMEAGSRAGQGSTADAALVGEHRGERCAGRHGAHVLREAEVDDQLHVGVVVRVAAARHLHELIRTANELGVRVQVVRRRHDDKLHGTLVTKGVVRPVADRHDSLRSGHAVVRDKNLADQPIAAALLHILPHPVLQRLGGLVVLGQIIQVRRRGGDHVEVRQACRGGRRRCVQGTAACPRIQSTASRAQRLATHLSGRPQHQDAETQP